MDRNLQNVKAMNPSPRPKILMKMLSLPWVGEDQGDMKIKYNVGPLGWILEQKEGIVGNLGKSEQSDDFFLPLFAVREDVLEEILRRVRQLRASKLDPASLPHALPLARALYPPLALEDDLGRSLELVTWCQHRVNGGRD